MLHIQIVSPTRYKVPVFKEVDLDVLSVLMNLVQELYSTSESCFSLPDKPERQKMTGNFLNNFLCSFILAGLC